MTVSVSVKNCTNWKEEFKLALWAWSTPKGIRKCWFPAGKNRSYSLGLALCPRANGFCKVAVGVGSLQAGHGNTHHTHRKTRVLVVYSSSLSSSCSPVFHSFDIVTSSLRLISHTKQSPARTELSFSRFVGLCAWRNLNFLSVWMLPEIFLGFLLDL